MDLTNHGAQATLQWVLGQGALTPPATMWLKLHIGDPGPAGVDNPAANSERQAVTFLPAASPAISGTAIGDADALTEFNVEWQALPATETYSHISIWDDENAGNAWYKGDMAAPVGVLAGGIFQFLAQNGLIRHE